MSPARDTLRLPGFHFRRGGRAVEGSGLENRQGCKPLEGSNPSLSAIAAAGPQPGPAAPPSREPSKPVILLLPGEVAEWLKALPC